MGGSIQNRGSGTFSHLLRWTVAWILLVPGGIRGDDLSFSGERAYDLLIKQCDFGPRNPGSPGHEAARKFLAEELRRWADRVSEQVFEHYDRERRATFQMANLIGSFDLENPRRILLCAHWDTRPFADEDENPENRDKPILGANDGASGVAVLLEIARLLRRTGPSIGVDIVLFDGEDYGRPGQWEDYLLGSRHFAKVKGGNYFPEMGVLLDMVGDADLDLYIERYSYTYFPKIVDRIWDIAAGMGFPQFHRQVKYAVMDDHIPLIENGIPCIDLIDFDYPYWHTLEDTPDRCSPQSLKIVGDVLMKVLYP